MPAIIFVDRQIPNENLCNNTLFPEVADICFKLRAEILAEILKDHHGYINLCFVRSCPLAGMTIIRPVAFPAIRFFPFILHQIATVIALAALHLCQRGYASVIRLARIRTRCSFDIFEVGPDDFFCAPPPHRP